jgi:V-type H+-transporting ATPase subunit a
MGATLYPIDANAERRYDALRQIVGRLEDLEAVLLNTDLNRRQELTSIGEKLASWRDVVRKERMIYETLNLFNFDSRRKTLIAEGWCPTSDITTIQLALRHATVSTVIVVLLGKGFSTVCPGGVRCERCTYSYGTAHEQDSTHVHPHQQVY